MKKILLIALVFMLLFTSVACDFENDQSENDTTETITTTVPYTNDPSGYIVDYGSFMIKSYEEYLNYVELVNQYLPDDFIYYDQISILGEFYNFQNLCETSDPKFPAETHDSEVTSYEYTVKIPQANQLVAIIIQSNGTTDWVKGYEIPDSLIDSKNLRLLLQDSKESGIYRTKGCIYSYNNGKLTDIYCQVGSSMICFSGAELCEITSDAGPIICLFNESRIDPFFDQILEIK